MADTTTLRLAQLDGIGLAEPSGAEIPKLKAEIAGLKETLNQVVLVLDAQNTQLREEIAALQQLLSSHLLSA